VSEPDEFVDFARARGPALLRFAYMLTHDRGQAEDLVQEALIKLDRKWNRLSNLDYPEAYVRRMIVNQFLSWRRRLSSRELVGPVPDAGRPDLTDSILDRDVVWRLLTTLPRRQQAVLAMRFYEDLSDIDIARVLDCSQPTVRSLASRALHTLRSAPGLSLDASSTLPRTRRNP
jgi:RNA polymerase sigma-70 factor (sigma-E family)